MKSILEILAAGATAAALAALVPVAQAGTSNYATKVNVGTAAAAVTPTSTPACAPQAASSPVGETKGSRDVKPVCDAPEGTANPGARTTPASQ